MFAQCGDNIRLPHSDDLFPQPKTKSSILGVPAEKETSFTSSGGLEEPAEELFWAFSKVYDQPDLVSII